MDEGDDSNPDRITSSAFATVNIFMQVKSVGEFEPQSLLLVLIFGPRACLCYLQPSNLAATAATSSRTKEEKRRGR